MMVFSNGASLSHRSWRYWGYRYLRYRRSADPSCCSYAGLQLHRYCRRQHCSCRPGVLRQPGCRQHHIKNDCGRYACPNAIIYPVLEKQILIFMKM